VTFSDPENETAVDIAIPSSSGGTTILVNRYADAPQDLSGVSGTAGQFRWIIQQTGLAQGFSASLRFNISQVPSNGITDPGSITVYSRLTPGRGSFSALPATYESGTGELVVDSIHEFGEFVFAMPGGTHALGTEGTPDQYVLAQNYPNPFNPETRIEFRIQKSEFARLSVYDLLGREVAVLVNEEKPPGVFTVTWGATGLTSGVYFYQLRAGEFVQTRRLILLR